MIEVYKMLTGKYDPTNDADLSLEVHVTSTELLLCSPPRVLNLPTDSFFLLVLCSGNLNKAFRFSDSSYDQIHKRFSLTITFICCRQQTTHLNQISPC